MKLDLFTNATVVDDAIRFVAGKFKDKAKSSSTNDNKNEKEESNEPDYDEDKDQLEEEQEEKLERGHHQRRIRFSESICIFAI